VQAIHRLRAAGFGGERIHVSTQDSSRPAAAPAGGHGLDTAVAATLAGGVLGAATALLVGAPAMPAPGVELVVGGPLAAALAGATGGRLLGGWVGGATDAEECPADDIVVTVDAGPRERAAQQALDAAAGADEHAD
jgi:hypothetical protein